MTTDEPTQHGAADDLAACIRQIAAIVAASADPDRALADCVQQIAAAVGRRPPAVRVRLPDERPGRVRKIRVADEKIILRLGEYGDGALGELFLTAAKTGATYQGLLDAVAIAVSVGLQYNIPVDVFCAKFEHTRFDPAGPTNVPNRAFATSPVDAIFAYLRYVYGYRSTEATATAAAGSEEPASLKEAP